MDYSPSFMIELDLKTFSTIIPKISLKIKLVTRWRELGMKKREPDGSLQVITFHQPIKVDKEATNK